MPRPNAPWFRKSRNRWYVTLHGKMVPLPVTDPKAEAAAWVAFQELLSRAKAGPPPARAEPLRELVAPYLEAIRHTVSPRTAAGYASYLRQLLSAFPNAAAADLDPAAVGRQASERAWSDSNRHNYLWAVQAFVRWCGRADFALDRPPKDSRGAEAVVSGAVHRAVLREATGDFHQLVRVLWETGARPMEAARLTAEQIDWTSGTATLRHHKTRKKGKGRPRVLYFTAEALAVLREQAERYKGTGPLFRGLQGKPLTLRALVGRMIRVQDRLGVRVTLYHYRHTFITRALERGIPDTHVAALVGHRDTSMIHGVYGHVSANGRLLREQAERASGGPDRAAG